MNYLTLVTLLMAELVRKKKNGMSLTNPKIERNARHIFADAVGINRKSSADVYIAEIGRAMADNGYKDRFDDLVRKLG